MDERTCPVDATALRRIERSGVHVDACPTCRGIWLDRGELDKIVERERADDDDFLREVGGSGRSRPEEHGRSHAPPKKKRRSFLDEFLDFG